MKINSKSFQERIKEKLGRYCTLPTNLNAHSRSSFIGVYGLSPRDKTDETLRKLLEDAFGVDFSITGHTHTTSSIGEKVARALEKKDQSNEKPDDRTIREFIEFKDAYLVDIELSSTDIESLKKIKITPSEVGTESNIILTPRLRREIGNLRSFDAENIFHEIIGKFNSRKRQ